MDHLLEPVRPYGMHIAGGLFGAAWFVFADVCLRSAFVTHAPVGFAAALPGVVATLALALMALIGREDADDLGLGYGDDGGACRAKCGLFIAYSLAFGSIAAAVVMLVLERQAGGGLDVGVGVVLQSAAICASGLLTWLSKAADGQDGYGLIF